MALTADEERAFAELAATLVSEARPAPRWPAGWLLVVIAIVCVLATACLTASVWL